MLFYLALALLIMGPLLSEGLILTLDMVFGPKAPSPTDLLYGFQAPVLGAKLLPQLLISGASVLAPMWLVQKLILVAIFVIAGAGAHRLPPVRRSVPAKVVSWWPQQGKSETAAEDWV